MDAHELLVDVIKQVITLATGILVFTVMFLEKIPLSYSDDEAAERQLKWLWICEGVAILFGLVVLLMLTGQLGRGTLNIYHPGVRIATFVQLAAFAAGAVLLWLLGGTFLALRRSGPARTVEKDGKPVSGARAGVSASDSASVEAQTTPGTPPTRSP